jgi:hypothetical protein
MSTALERPSESARTLAAVAHGLTFVEGGIIGPLVVYLVKRDEDEFVAFHALQSLYFGLLLLAVVFLTCGIGAILALPYVIFEVIAVMKAHEGEWYLLPVVGEWAYAKHHP